MPKFRTRTAPNTRDRYYSSFHEPIHLSIAPLLGLSRRFCCRLQKFGWSSRLFRSLKRPTMSLERNQHPQEMQLAS